MKGVANQINKSVPTSIDMTGNYNVAGTAGKAGGLSGGILVNAVYNVIDKQTAQYANNDLVRKMQGRGLAGAVR